MDEKKEKPVRKDDEFVIHEDRPSMPRMPGAIFIEHRKMQSPVSNLETALKVVNNLLYKTSLTVAMIQKGLISVDDIDFTKPPEEQEVRDYSHLTDEDHESIRDLANEFVDAWLVSCDENNEASAIAMDGEKLFKDIGISLAMARLVIEDEITAVEAICRRQ